MTGVFTKLTNVVLARYPEPEPNTVFFFNSYELWLVGFHTILRMLNVINLDYYSCLVHYTDYTGEEKKELLCIVLSSCNMR